MDVVGKFILIVSSCFNNAELFPDDRIWTTPSNFAHA